MVSLYNTVVITRYILAIFSCFLENSECIGPTLLTPSQSPRWLDLVLLGPVEYSDFALCNTDTKWFHSEEKNKKIIIRGH